MLGRRHARTRHVPLVPPLLVLNEARPGAPPSCGSLNRLRRGGSFGGGSRSFFGLLFRDGITVCGSFSSSRSFGGGTFGLFGSLSNGLVLWSSWGGGRSLVLLLHGLAWLTEEASQLRRDWGLDLGFTLGGFALSGLSRLLFLLSAKGAEERCSAFILEVTWGGSLLCGGSDLFLSSWLLGLLLDLLGLISLLFRLSFLLVLVIN